jgi:hypothetical protein
VLLIPQAKKEDSAKKVLQDMFKGKEDVLAKYEKQPGGDGGDGGSSGGGGGGGRIRLSA